MNIARMIEKANEAHANRGAVLTAMPRKEFDVLRAEWTRKASRKNADIIWVMARAQADRIAFLRDGGTIEEYREVIRRQREARKARR